jgi:arginine/lysine/ornithine decarboxylase
MIERRIKRIQLRALMVDDELPAPTAEGHAAWTLVQELTGRAIEVVEAPSAEDGMSVVASDSAIHALLIDWSLGSNGERAHDKARALLEFVRSRNDKVPIFLMAERGEASSIPVDVMQMIDEYVWTLEDTAAFVGGRVVAAMRRYIEVMMPPLAAAVMKFSQEYAYSWHTPGHTGGTAFLKSPVGRMFFDYFGENLLRSDLSISVGALGSLLDHSGPMGAHEKYAARVFGAHRTYSVTNGTSMSNRVIFMAAVARDQIALCDRNCHKSIEHSLVMTGAIPTYLVPVRNRYGIIGPILPERLKPEAIKAAIKANPLVTKGIDTRPVHSIVTNSTYDGLCYNARRVAELLDPSVDRIHFDEAWYAYARFNPLYRDRHAMYGDPKDYTKGPTIFATHSTHKLLAALSQASFLHIRDGRKPIPHSRFNESYMLHASTSPFYPIIVSNDVTAAMMDGAGGIAITAESIQEAVAFRQTMARVHREFAAKKEWFFTTWNPDKVKQGKNGKTVAFADAAPEFLATEPDVWVLHPGDAWHGFGDIEDGYCMLDPIKVSIVTPGMTENGLDKKGIPATLVTAYLHRRGVEVEKTTDFTILLLFSIGITKGKWGTLLNALLDFKRDYDRNSPLTEVLPDLASSSPAAYGGIGLRDLADQMFAQLKETKQTHWLSEAFSTLPRMEMSPNAAYQHLVKDEIEHVPLDKLAHRVLATSVVPYPPGIPMLMPGEAHGCGRWSVYRLPKALAAWDARFLDLATIRMAWRTATASTTCNVEANPGKA